ncbi:MAG: ATP-grasp domain-containing protein [Pseudomonadota bacterium]
MPLMSNILVTGCGGDIGISVCRLLKKHDIADQVFGCDIHNDHPGSHFFDKCFTIERADSVLYLESLEKIITANDISMVIPISEAELRLFSRMPVKTELYNAKIITANFESMAIGFDKLETSAFLKEKKMEYPWTIPTSEGLPMEIPCILKNRYGSGSRDVRLIESLGEARLFQHRSDNDIWQEYLEPDHEEYTCAVFVSGSNLTDIRTIIMKRELQGGLTGKGEVSEDQKIGTLLCRLAKEIQLRGSINVQLRLTKRGPVIFEINPRFSSTIVFRDLLGFQDLLWVIQDACGLNVARYKNPKSGTRFFRSAKEIII